MSYLLFLYYIAISLGISFSMLSLFSRFACVQGISRWTLGFLGFCLFPVFISWLSFAGLFRIPYIVELIGAAFAIYAFFYLWRIRYILSEYIKISRISKAYLGSAILFVTCIGALIVSRYCYIYGGSTNWPWDDIRGLSFISSFSANFLQPADPLDLSHPISYSYYYYEYLAFLYSAVQGTYYPSLLLLLASILATACFYFSFAFFCRQCVSANPALVLTAALLTLNFFGLDFAYNDNREYSDAWNFFHVAHTVTYSHYLFHYLMAASCALTGWVYLKRALEHQGTPEFIIAIAFSLLSITYAAVIGVFLMMTMLLSAILYLLYSKFKLLGWLICNPNHWIWAALLIISIITPQIFAFWGRSSYLSLLANPMLPFSHQSAFPINIYNWLYDGIILFKELGSMHVMGLILLPISIRKIWLSSPFMGLSTIALIIITIMGSMFIQSDTNDWYWHGTSAGYVLLACISTVIFLVKGWDYCEPKCVSRTFYYVVLIGLFAPGAYNFFNLQYNRFSRCDAPPANTLLINERVPLHLPVLYGDTSLYRAGRAIIVPDTNDSNVGLLHVYRLPEDFIKKYNLYTNIEDATARTWYGKRMPMDFVACNEDKIEIVKNQHLCLTTKE